MSNKVEFQILSDKHGMPIRLDRIPMEAALSLTTLITSLTNIASETALGEVFSLRLDAGSVVVTGNFTDIHLERIKTSIEDATNHRCENEIIVNSCKEIQKIVKANGVNYDFKIRHNDHIFELNEVFKKAKIKLRVPHISETRIRFIKGELIAVGGKNPNIHIKNIYNDKEEVSIMSCSPEQAMKAKKYLYSEILLSCWCEYYFDDELFTHKGILCDTYRDNERFVKFQRIVNDIRSLSGIDRYKKIHYVIKNMLDKRQFLLASKVMTLFNNESSDVSSLKTALIITKAFKENAKIKQVRKDLLRLLEKKIGKIT